MRKIERLIRRWSKDQRGNLTMIMALVAIPLVAISGLAIDMNRIVEARSQIQSVADGAALAAALAKGTDAQRIKVGKAYVKANLTALHGVTTTPTVTVNNKKVSVIIDTLVDGTLLAVAFTKAGSYVEGENANSGNNSLPTVEFQISSGAEAQAAEGYYRCMIALNTSMADAIYIRGTGDFTATDCAVHSDSSHASTSIHLQGNATAIADKFTAAGGWTQTGGAGSFSITPEGDKPVSGDPIALSVTTPAGVASSANIKKQDGNVSLSDTKYSDITIGAQGTASFTAGTHYITGTLSMGSQATITGNGVTLILAGSNAKIDMNSGSTLQLQAPTGGTYAGYAVIGDRSATMVQTNTIQGGAGGYIRGVWYTPKHKLYITGNGGFNSSSSYFPVIVDNIEIGGNGVFNLGFDYAAYNFPEPVKLYYSQSAKARLTD